MEVVRYRPGEAIRWLQTGAQGIRRGARSKSKSLVEANGGTFGQNLKTAAGALVDYGKGAYADLMHRQADASEYVLLENHFDVVRGSAIKSIEYNRVKKIEMKADKATFTLDSGNISIKPFAHVVSGRARVPVGWSRNGIEVPFELLIDELAARCGVEVEEVP